MTLNAGYVYREQLGPGAGGQRVLSYLAARYRHSPEHVWRQRLAGGEVRLGGQVAVGHEILRAGQVLEWHRPPWREEEVPWHYGLAYEDEALLAVIKPSGLPTTHGGGFLANTLLSLVRESYPEASPLHRLGRGTSGLVLFARTGEAASGLARAWREHEVHKRYRALGSGVASQQHYGVTVPIGSMPHPRLGSVYAASERGKASRSEAQVLERREGSTLFQVDIQTGRPHQIRIHLAAIGHPLVGDPLYEVGGHLRQTLPGLPGDGGYWLHAGQLTFVHPLRGTPLELNAPFPPELLTHAGG